MESARLELLLAAGPSLRFDVLEISRRLVAAGRSSELLFRTAFLNRSILLKHVDRGVDRRGAKPSRPIQTLVYFPYDPVRPESGGESFVYSHEALRALYASKTGIVDALSEELLHDEAILDRLDELPALNPFVLRELCAADGKGIPEAYLQLDEFAVARLQRRLARRVRPLIVAALGSEGEQVGKALRPMVEAFVNPCERHRLRGLAASLHLDPEEAVGVLAAWAGIAFFEDEIAQLKPRVQTFLQELVAAGEPTQWLASSDHGRMPDRLAALRGSMRVSWLELRSILECYQESYDALVFNGVPQPFVAFLRESRQHYWRLGEVCARYEQAVRAWGERTQRYAQGKLPPDVVAELVDFLEQLFPAVSDGRAGGGPAASARRLAS